MIKALHVKLMKKATLLVTVAWLSLAATTAFAASTITGPVGVIEYYQGTLIVQSASINYYGQLTTQAGCTSNNQTIDTLKAWQSLGQAAVLSGIP